MPRMLADGKKKFVILPAAPANMNAVKLSEATAGKDYSSAILSSDFDMGFADSDRHQEKPLSVSGNAEALGNSNFQGGFTVFRDYVVATGLPVAAATSLLEELWGLVRVKGGIHHILIRTGGKVSSAPFTVDDEYIYVEWQNDNPASPTLEGDIKHRISGVPIRFSDSVCKIVASA